MGQLIEGAWTEDDATATTASGTWKRTPSVVRDWIRADGSTPFTPEAGRYHLWLSWSCTWSHRALLVRNLLGLQDVISVSMAHWHRNRQGWWFPEGLDGLQPEAEQSWESWSAQDGFQDAPPKLGLPLWRVYTEGNATHTGRATVPVLWDRERQQVVSNESADILRMLEREFSALSNGTELLPTALLESIDATNAWVYDSLNNGVYKAGFARSQGAYEDAVRAVFAGLERADALLGQHRFLCGNQLTEADVRLFPTLVRFVPVYYGHFRCNLRPLESYEHLAGYLRDLYQTPGFAETVNIEAYKLGYMGRSERLNPSRIIPIGPGFDLEGEHERDRFR